MLNEGGRRVLARPASDLGRLREPSRTAAGSDERDQGQGYGAEGIVSGLMNVVGKL